MRLVERGWDNFYVPPIANDRGAMDGAPVYPGLKTLVLMAFFPWAEPPATPGPYSYSLHPASGWARAGRTGLSGGGYQNSGSTRAISKYSLRYTNTTGRGGHGERGS
jgi:hypothetical protein